MEEKARIAVKPTRTDRDPAEPTGTWGMLASTNALVARISETISDNREDPENAKRILPAVDHELNWDPELSAAAGYIVASVMEWPSLSRVQAISSTMSAIADFYRIKLSGGTTGARAKITHLKSHLRVPKGRHGALEDGKSHYRCR